MAKIIKFDGDEMVVSEAGPVGADGNPTGTVRTIGAAQVAVHRVMFDAYMSAAQRIKADAVAAKFAPVDEVAAK